MRETYKVCRGGDTPGQVWDCKHWSRHWQQLDSCFPLPHPPLFPLVVSSAFRSLLHIGNGFSVFSYCMTPKACWDMRFPLHWIYTRPGQTHIEPPSVHLEPVHLWISLTSTLTLAPHAAPPHHSWFRKGESGLVMCSEPLGQGWIQQDWRGLMKVYNSRSSQRQESIKGGCSLRASSWIYETTILGQKWIEMEIWHMIDSECWVIHLFQEIVSLNLNKSYIRSAALKLEIKAALLCSH